MTDQAAAVQETPPRAITSVDEARDVIRMLDETITALVEVIEEEDRLVRAGKLADVARLSPTKTSHARRYLAGSLRLRDSLPRLRGELGGELSVVKARHAAFQDRLQSNLTALATAHAVSEDIVRGVAGELTRTASPQTYGASGRTPMPDPRHVRPLAVSRTL
ncbi:hypothetical protein CCR97_30135 [Rhodoplanes elegans]|uniref:Flagellar basal-body protein FlbY n=1 Tax=Rhodoplanes elegans TaxID=29408 RepID=A0A327KM30_9BRAD|nr:hypothetical protein [Rhodoplanes elegans]MBK5962417.1 hypothetical protein [Rhodoplanes elegans]RAI39557.1 hypothetical protein CH338_09030 [Rhodoplanes elegans]